MLPHFVKIYTKLYFDPKHLEKGLNRGKGDIFDATFSKVPFLANIERCPKCLEYALPIKSHDSLNMWPCEIGRSLARGCSTCKPLACQQLNCIYSFAKFGNI